MGRPGNLLFFIPVLLIVVLGSGCNKDYVACYGPFHIINDTLMEVEGDMGGRVEKQMQKALDKYPTISMIIMKKCPGSRDDAEMMEAARLVRSHQIHVHLAEDGQIESGAVDFFLAGHKRTYDIGGRFGVHAWSDGKDEAADFPAGHSEHLLYINYYEEMGFSRQEAEDLYYFIINAADSDGMHWMTEQEILHYKLAT